MTYLDSDQEGFAMDDLGNRVGNAHGYAARCHGVMQLYIAATNRHRLGNTYAADSLTNRYTAIDANSLAYDDAGNLTTDKDGYHTVYDYENRPVRIYKLNGQTQVTVATLDYDALGRRIRKVDAIANTASLYYYSDNWQVLAEYNGSGTVQKTFVFGNYIDEVLVMTNYQPLTTNDYYYLHDHLYSPVALLDNTGAVVERYEYDAYGTCRILTPGFGLLTSSQFGNSFLFQGHTQDRFDSGSLKLYDFRYRVYDTFAGRWYQQEKLGMMPERRIGNLTFSPTIQYEDGLSLYLPFYASPSETLDPYGLWSLLLRVHTDLAGAAWSTFNCDCCAKGLLFKFGLQRGSNFPDAPIDFPWWAFTTVGQLVNVIQDGVTMYQSHEGALAWWHGMARSNEDDADAIQKMIINRVVGAASQAQSTSSCYDKGFILGDVMHTIQDTYARSHTYRDGGAIKQFQYYRAQDGKKHATADTADNAAQYNEALEASKALLQMVLCDKASSSTIQSTLMNGILRLAPGASAGGTLPEYKKTEKPKDNDNGTTYPPGY